MQHPNVGIVQALYGAFMARDTERLIGGLAPDVRLHNSGYDSTAGTYEGRDTVLGYFIGEDHMEDYALELVDMLASDERVAVIARSSGRRGAQRISNDFIQVIRLENGVVTEIWTYVWDQRAAAEFMAVPML